MRKLSEDEKLLKAIEENQKRQRALNIKRAKEQKKRQVVSAIIGSAATIGFFAAIGLFLAIVEHINF